MAGAANIAGRINVDVPADKGVHSRRHCASVGVGVFFWRSCVSDADQQKGFDSGQGGPFPLYILVHIEKLIEIGGDDAIEKQLFRA